VRALAVLCAVATPALAEPKCPAGTKAYHEDSVDMSDEWITDFGTVDGCTRDGKLDGDVTVTSHEQVTHGRYTAGKRTGTWKRIWRASNGPSRTMSYRDGVADGPLSDTLSTGKLSMEGQLKRGVMAGVWTYYVGGAKSNEIDWDRLHAPLVTCAAGATLQRVRLPGLDGNEAHYCERQVDGKTVRDGAYVEWDTIRDEVTEQRTYRAGSIVTK
jgi:hypothetical protein